MSSRRFVASNRRARSRSNSKRFSTDRSGVHGSDLVHLVRDAARLDAGASQESLEFFNGVSMDLIREREDQDFLLEHDVEGNPHIVVVVIIQVSAAVVS